MLQYTARRLLQAVVVLLGVTIITFILVHLLPGGPARALLGAHATPGKIAALNNQFGLNKPIVLQYLIWLGNLAHGQLGFSYVHQVPVSQLIRASLPNSILLGTLATIEALLVAIPLGILQALRPRSAIDITLTTLAFVLYSMPIFFIGSLAILYLGIQRHIFPVGGIGAIGAGPIPFTTRLYYALLPSMVLAVVQIAAWSRYMRSSMLDTIVQDYMRTARAKGLTMRRAVFTHGMRNALLPIITLIGLSLPTLIGGVVVVESVFNYPGMGYLLWQGAQQYDFPVVLGVTVVAGIATVIGNLIADLLYAVTDPRIRDG